MDLNVLPAANLHFGTHLVAPVTHVPLRLFMILHLSDVYAHLLLHLFKIIDVFHVVLPKYLIKILNNVKIARQIHHFSPMVNA